MFFGLIFFLSIANAFAHSCDPIDLRGKLGPPRQQLNTDSCFAKATADAVTVATGQRVADYSVGVRYYQNRPTLEAAGLSALIGTVAGPYRGGFAPTALQTSIDSSLCTEKEVGDSDDLDGEELDDLIKLYSHYSETMDYTSAKAQIPQICGAIRHVFPQAQLSNLRSILDSTHDLASMLGAVMDKNCHALKGRLKGYSVVGTSLHQSAKEIVSSINAALDSGQLPVVHMDPSFLNGLGPSPLFDYVGVHVGSVAARREVGGECWYLFRNTYGPSCVGARSGNKLLKYPEEIARRCEDGSFWMTEKEITQYMTSASYLKAPAK